MMLLHDGSLRREDRLLASRKGGSLLEGYTQGSLTGGTDAEKTID